MKRILAFILACTMMLACVGCVPKEELPEPVRNVLDNMMPLMEEYLPKADMDEIPDDVRNVLDNVLPAVKQFVTDFNEDELYTADFPGDLTLWDRPDVTPKPTPEPTPEPTPAPTPAPAPKYVNPLNGSALEEPYTGRVFASTISNVQNAIPHNGLNQADVVYESFVNGSVVRLLALYSDIASVEAFGGVRSTRPIFHDLVQHFDAVLLHSGGASAVLNQLNNLPIDAYNIDGWELRNANTSFRSGGNRAYENSLMGNGANIVSYAEKDGMSLTQPADKDYGLSFADEGTPANGSAANEISVVFKFAKSSKETIMKYDADLDSYVFWQYTKAMWDLRTGEKETFKNVIIMNTEITAPTGYHHADFNKGGGGYFACGGQIVPIKWTCEGQDKPFKYTLEDGTALNLERGNTYVAIAPIGSVITYN